MNGVKVHCTALANLVQGDDHQTILLSLYDKENRLVQIHDRVRCDNTQDSERACLEAIREKLVLIGTIYGSIIGNIAKILHYIVE